MSSQSQPEPVKTDYKFIDIGVNLTDPVFRGVHHGRKKHDDDFDAMMERSRAAGVKSMILTGGSLRESEQALQLAEVCGMWATVGCHPTRSTEFDKTEGGPDAYLESLSELVEKNSKGKGRAVAIGECGLDYDRTHFASPEVQKKHFRSQLSLAKKHHLPLFLHSRAAHADLVSILREEGFGEDGGKAVGGKGGVVHSFTGTVDEVKELVCSMLFLKFQELKNSRCKWAFMSGNSHACCAPFISSFAYSVNGCSLKTEDNLKAAQAIKLDKLMLETDAPWCSCTSTHASKKHLDTLPATLRALYFPPSTKPEGFVYGKPVKGRNEPSAIGGVAWVMHKLLNVSLEALVEQAWSNTVEVFGLDDI